MTPADAADVKYQNAGCPRSDRATISHGRVKRMRMDAVQGRPLRQPPTRPPDERQFRRARRHRQRHGRSRQDDDDAPVSHSRDPLSPAMLARPLRCGPRPLPMPPRAGARRQPRDEEPGLPKTILEGTISTVSGTPECHPRMDDRKTSQAITPTMSRPTRPGLPCGPGRVRSRRPSAKHTLRRKHAEGRARRNEENNIARERRPQQFLHSPLFDLKGEVFLDLVGIVRDDVPVRLVIAGLSG